MNDASKFFGITLEGVRGIIFQLILTSGFNRAAIVFLIKILDLDSRSPDGMFRRKKEKETL